MISPELIRNNSIPVKYVIQKPGEIIITFPYAYHAGFNHGFNCAEAVNFATIRWIDFGKRATLCTCHDPSHIVRINMHSFVRRYQPDRYYKWLEGTHLFFQLNLFLIVL
jgi:jumonji domain-containing protein 2